MTIELELQIATNVQTLPHPAQFREWVGAALAERIDTAELTIRIVDIDEITELNQTYRKKPGPTNVLSFPADIEEEFGMPLLGDVVICAEVVQREALEADIDLLAHWAHMVVHGTLHLLGYDHIQPDEAEIMETIEEDILTNLGYPAPYGEKNALMSDKNLLKRIKNIFVKHPKNITDLINVLKKATASELLEPNTLSMIEGVLDVQETRVKDVMVPRSQMVTLEKSMTLDALIPIVLKSRHSRYPVIGENKDEVAGIMLAKDLLDYGFDNTLPFNIQNLIRPAIFIPENKRLNVLLQEFRLNRNHMAIVVDEYGRITGLITIEDVLEQIVGEIEDEHDTDTTPSINPQTDGMYTVKALTSIQEFNSYFNSDINDENIETIGGVILRTMGRLPKRGESVKVGDFQFKILRADNRRIYLLSVMPNDS